MSNDKYDYAVRTAGFFYGKYLKKLDRIRLTSKQAKYEIMAGNLYERGKEPSDEIPRPPPVEIEAPKASEKSPRRGRRVSEST